MLRLSSLCVVLKVCFGNCGMRRGLYQWARSFRMLWSWFRIPIAARCAYVSVLCCSLAVVRLWELILMESVLNACRSELRKTRTCIWWCWQRHCATVSLDLRQVKICVQLVGYPDTQGGSNFIPTNAILKRFPKILEVTYAFFIFLANSGQVYRV